MTPAASFVIAKTRNDQSAHQRKNRWKSQPIRTLKNHTAAKRGYTTAAPNEDAPQDVTGSKNPDAEESIPTRLLRGASQAGKAELRVTESDMVTPGKG